MSSITNHQLDESYRRYFRNSIDHEKQRLRKLIAQYPGTVFAAVLKDHLKDLSGKKNLNQQK